MIPPHIPLGVNLKFWFFKQFWWLLCCAVAGTLATLLVLNEPLTTVATVTGAILSVAYFLQKQRLEELRLFRELFKEFNERYDGMNDELGRIADLGDIELFGAERQAVVKYFNLCGEEYLYFKLGYIFPSVWIAWHTGMRTIVRAPSINRVWKSEKATDSYYDLPL